MAAQNKRREEEKERVERKLEELRSQVRVEAQRDPERTVQPTVASDARFAHLNGGAHSETAYEPLNAQLFSVNTFNSKSTNSNISNSSTSRIEHFAAYFVGLANKFRAFRKHEKICLPKTAPIFFIVRCLSR